MKQRMFNLKIRSTEGINMTEGSIPKQLLLFAFPILVSSLIQQMYNTVALIFVGRYIGKEASAAVGASSLLVFCMIGIFTGMSVGTGVVVGKYFGAKEYDKVNDAVHTSAAISLYGGIIFTVVGIVFSPLLLKWMNTPPELMNDAIIYIRIYFLSFISIISYNMGSGIMRALGDSKRPMMYQLIGGISNIFANYLFIRVLNWEITGAALAALCSQTIAAILVTVHFLRLHEGFKLILNQIHLKINIAMEILKVGIPAGIQATAITFSNIFVQYHINSLGVDNIAAFTAYFRVELFIYLPIMAVSQAISSFSAQNIGADRMDRIRQGVRISIRFGCVMALALSMLAILYSSSLFSFFSSSESVVEIGVSLAKITFPFYFIYVFLEVFASAIRGTGKSLPPMIIILLIVCGVRLVLLNIFMKWNPVPETIAVVYPITWFLASVFLGLYYKKVIDAPCSIAGDAN